MGLRVKVIHIRLWRPPYTRLSRFVGLVLPLAPSLALVGVVACLAPLVDPVLGFVTSSLHSEIMPKAPGSLDFPDPHRDAFPSGVEVGQFSSSDGLSTASLTLVAPPSPPGALFVAIVQSWATNTSVATAYLAANSSTTIVLPIAKYHLLFATGFVWEGRDRLFGDATQAYRLRRPIDLSPLPDGEVSGDLVFLSPLGAAREASRPPLAPPHR